MNFFRDCLSSVMKHRLHVLGIALFIFVNLFSIDACAHIGKSHHQVIKYIQGGAPSGGDGSKCHPYNSLSQAEGGNWNVLIVLPSPTVIYGGIALEDGQKIKGKNRKECIFASLDGLVHNGDVIVVNGDNSISGITIATSFRCGIEALNAKNLTVKNCSINQCNSSRKRFSRDYAPFSADITETSFWFAISFFGGPTVETGIQPCNTRNGKVTIHDCSFDSNAAGITVGSGNSISTSFVAQTFKRKYDISQCQFSNTVGPSTVIFAAGGGFLEGSISKNSYNTLGGQAIAFNSLRANNPNFPGRGNYKAGKMEVTQCTFSNITLFGFICFFRGNLTGGDAQFIAKDNTFTDVGLLGNVPPAVIEFGAASIQAQIENTASGCSFEWIVHDNVITDSTGLVPSISSYFGGGSQKIIADIQRNIVVGTTTGVDILFLNQGGPSQASGKYNIAHNKFTNNDSVLVVLTTPDSPFTDLKVNVEENFFENTGARNSPPLQEPSFNNGNYYGGAVIFGGANNTAAQIIGLNGTNLGNAIVDLGGGALKSKGHNSFINATGAVTWVEPGLFLSAKKNWFGGQSPIDARVGGIVVFDPILCIDPLRKHSHH